jgi:hypothetical protein
MNPARSLAAAVMSGELRDLWIYFVAPFVGAALARLATPVLHSREHSQEHVAKPIDAAKLLETVHRWSRHRTGPP